MFNTDTHARFVAIPGHKKGVLAQINALILAHKSRVALAQLDETGRADVGLTIHWASKDGVLSSSTEVDGC